MFCCVRVYIGLVVLECAGGVGRSVSGESVLYATWSTPEKDCLDP